MKNLIALICLVFSFFHLKAQTFDTTFVKKVGVEICECLSQQTYSTDGMEEYFDAFQGSCAVEILRTKYVDKLDAFQAETKKNGTNISVQNMFFAFFNIAQVVMVDDCDLVFDFYESQKELNARAVRDLYAEKAAVELPKIIKAIKEDNQTDFIPLRGLMYFSIDSLEKAEADLSSAFETETFEAKDYLMIQLYAYTLELNGKYDEAITFYEEIAVKKPVPFEFYLAVAKRKKREAILEKNNSSSN